ncbi:MAG: FGGY-family carbohydrate kinase [Thermoguttaceae bacterium]|nr:FGGY-family carbohydrate kinase [Thermoguttaceae bacterium]
MTKKILSFDLGTGGNKATLFDVDGTCLASAFVEYGTSFPNVGWYEQKPEDWRKAVVESARKLIAESRVDATEIAAVALSGHSLGCVPLDEDGALLREQTPIWSDVRATEEADEFFKTIDPTQWYLETGGGFSAEHYTAFKIMWYRKHEPDMFAKTRKFVGTKDYINYYLTGRIVTDPGYASGCGVWNLPGWDYEPAFLKAAGLDRSLFPDVVPSTEPIGALTAQAADDMGLSRETLVVCGSVDNSCMALGAGAFKRGRSYASMGSSTWIAVSDDRLELDPATKPYVFAHCVPGFYAIALALYSSGTTFRWVKDAMCSDLIERSKAEGRNVYELAIEEAATSAPGANGLLMNPSLAGGASQDGTPKLRGGFLGLDLSHTRADLLRASLEGIALGLRNVRECLFARGEAGDSMTVVGGGAISPIWRQIYADVMKTTIVKTNVGQNAAALGAAALAAVGAGLWSSFDKVDELVQQGESAVPNSGLAELYDKKYADYLFARELLAKYAER